jgi:uracil-DNA glycosylase family 4
MYQDGEGDSMMKGPRCSGCPWERKGSDYIPGVAGKGPIKILAIFERPGTHETGDCRCDGKHEVGVPLVGPTGRIVEQSLGGWDGVYRTNIRKCNAKAKDKDENAATIAFCTENYLRAEIEELEKSETVQSVILGGADAAAAFYGAGAEMAKLQGSCWTREELEAIYEAID